MTGESNMVLENINKMIEDIEKEKNYLYLGIVYRQLKYLADGKIKFSTLEMLRDYLQDIDDMLKLIMAHVKPLSTEYYSARSYATEIEKML